MWINKKKFEEITNIIFQRIDMIDTKQMDILAKLAILEEQNDRIIELKARINSIDIAITEFYKKFEQTVMPVYNIPEPKKFVPKDKALYLEEEKEYINLYR